MTANGSKSIAKKGAGCVAALAAMALGFVLWFMVLRHINATESMWLIFWLMIPFAVVTRLIAELL